MKQLLRNRENYAGHAGVDDKSMNIRHVRAARFDENRAVTMP